MWPSSAPSHSQLRKGSTILSIPSFSSCLLLAVVSLHAWNTAQEGMRQGNKGGLAWLGTLGASSCLCRMAWQLMKARRGCQLGPWLLGFLGPLRKVSDPLGGLPSLRGQEIALLVPFSCLSMPSCLPLSPSHGTLFCS